MVGDFLKKIKYGEPIIVVSGLPRSGTSMLMKMLEAGGVPIASDGIRTPDDDNPQGYYELERVKKLDKDEDKHWVKELRGMAAKVISFLLKDLPTDNRYKVVFVERDLTEVMASQNKMLEHRGVPVNPENDGKMMCNFENHLAQVKDELQRDHKFTALYLNHRAIIARPQEAAARINQFLGGQLDEARMAAVVDGTLYRNRAEG